MSRPLICSSIRKRCDWAALLPALLQSRTSAWKETTLDTHDIAIPLWPGEPSSRAVFRGIFLSTQDVGKDETRKRIERLYNLNGGQHIAIVLLMDQQGPESPMASLMRLQLELLDGSEMPIISVSSVRDAPQTIMAFHRQLSTMGAAVKRYEASCTLLPYCSDTQKLPEHTVHILTDITTNLKDLSDKAITPEGQSRLMEFLGEDAERVINFWKEEHLVD